MPTPLGLSTVVSGGQTGADQGGLRAARASGIATGGWAPKGWATEDGPAPWLADFGLAECSTPGYPARTTANARDSDGTIWFGRRDTSGCRTTMNACRRHAKPVLIVIEGQTTADHVIDWISANNIIVLNVAGNRESDHPGLGNLVESLLSRVFWSLAAADATAQCGPARADD